MTFIWPSIILTSLFVLLFQNCTGDVRFLGGGPMAKSGGTGNGGSYDGKPEGTYLRYVPDFVCDGQAQAKAKMQFSSEFILHSEVQAGVCQREDLPLTVDQLDISVLQQEFLGYKGAIFKRFEQIATGIPANLVEVSCRDKNSASGVEVVTHYNQTARAGEARIYYGTAGTVQVVPDFAVARVLTAAEIDYQATAFALRVNFFAPSPEPFRFRGELSMTLNGVPSTREVHCLLGGQLDPAVWPGKEVLVKAASVAETTWAGENQLISADSLRTHTLAIFDYATSQLRVTKVPGIFEIPGYTGRPYSALPDGRMMSIFRPLSVQGELKYWIVNPEPLKLVEPTQDDPGVDWARAAPGIALWWRDASSGVGLMSFSRRDPDIGVGNYPMGSFGVRSDSWRMTPSGDFDGDRRLIINRPGRTLMIKTSSLLPAGKTSCFTSYLFQLNQLAVIQCPDPGSTQIEIRLLTDSLDLARKVTIPFEAGWVIAGAINTWLPGGDLLILPITKDDSPQVHQLIVRLTDGAHILLAEDQILDVTKDNNWLLARSATDGKFSIFSMTDSRQYPLGENVASALLAPSGLSVYVLASSGQLSSINLASRATTPVCANVQVASSLLSRPRANSVSPEKILVLRDVESPGMTEVFDLENGQCLKRNSFPLRLKGKVHAHSSGDEPHVVLTETSLSPEPFRQSVFVIPMDGRPVRWLNPGGVNFNTVRLLKTLKGHNKLLIQNRSGNSITELNEKFFLFQL